MALIAGMRDKLIHVYDEVDLDEVWKTLERDLPDLLAQVEPLLGRRFDAELEAAHAHCSNNEETIRASAVCGCFYCLAIFEAREVTQWVNIRSGRPTALCPHCGIDAVLGSASGLPITADFLGRMKSYWF